MFSFSAVILVNETDTGMKSNKCSALHKVCSKPILKRVYETLKKSGSKNTLFVADKQQDNVIATMGEDASFKTLKSFTDAKNLLENHEGTIVALRGELPLISEQTILNAVKYHEENNNSVTVISYRSQNDKQTANEENYETTHSDIYCFNCHDLFDVLSKSPSNNNLEDIAQEIKNAGKKADILPVSNPNELLLVNNKTALAAVQKIKQAQIIHKHLTNGVTIIDTDNTYIDDEVEIAPDAVIYPGVFLKGNTKIASECIIGPASTIENSSVGKNTKIINSVVIDSTIAEHSDIGPFAYLRPNSIIGSNVKIGDFVEIKNSSIGDGTKVSHLTYVGDSDVGKGVNFGCGTVTVNYDGVNKHRTVIGDNVFLGCNTNLVAPVKVANNSVIAAGSTITEDVDEYSLAIARSRQTQKKNWARNFGWNKKKNK